MRRHVNRPARSASRLAPRLALAVALAAGLALAAACGPEEEVDPGPEVLLPEATTADLFVLTRGADLVVAGEVVSVGPAPGRWAEPRAYQGVTYRVLETFLGSAPEGELRVAHPVSRLRPFVDEEEIGLSARHVAPGARFVLFVSRDGDARVRYPTAGGDWASEYVVTDDRKGVLVYDDATVKEVRDAVAAHAKSRGGGGDPFSRRGRR